MVACPPFSWTCTLFLCSLIFSLGQSLPLPSLPFPSVNHEIRSPDPRLNPENTDLLSNFFVKAGLEKLDELNKSWGGGDDDGYDDPDIIDDSHSTQPTETSHDNNLDKQKENFNKETQSDLKDPSEDPAGFVESLFEHLKKKFREAFNSSDEIPLNTR